MPQSPWDPWVWQQVSDLLQHAERIQRNFLQAAAAVFQGTIGQTASWSPRLVAVETDQVLWVISALPGVPADEIEVRLESNELIITGRRPLPQCCSSGEFKVLEIPFGRFERRWHLPPDVSFALGETREDRGLLFVELKKV
jgi:HSP20 family molecular chaperone IbpA